MRSHCEIKSYSVGSKFKDGQCDVTLRVVLDLPFSEETVRELAHMTGRVGLRMEIIDPQLQLEFGQPAAEPKGKQKRKPKPAPIQGDGADEYAWMRDTDDQDLVDRHAELMDLIQRLDDDTPEDNQVLTSTKEEVEAIVRELYARGLTVERTDNGFEWHEMRVEATK